MDHRGLERGGVRWFGVAGFSICGSILAIYRNEAGDYCAHAGDEWQRDQEPLFGYFDADLSFDQVIDQLSTRYDDMRNIKPI